MRLMKIIVSWGLVFAWMFLIFSLSSQPAIESKELSTGVLDIAVNTIETLVPDIENYFTTDQLHFFIRKSAHLFLYFILGFLIYNAVNISSIIITNKKIIYSILLAILFASFDEFHQVFVPGRSGEVSDVLIDGVGATIGVWSYLVLCWLKQRVLS